MNSVNGHSNSPSKAGLSSSPRSPTDSNTYSSSPFLHNLQQRFRKSSNASSNNSDPPLSPEPPKNKAEASRNAKRFLQSVVRDDWKYDVVDDQQQDEPSGPYRKPLGYRQREEGMSDLEIDTSPTKRRSKSDPYRFENPESLAILVAERKRKRRKIIQDEMEWNVGMKSWVLQRDAWTGALKNKPKQQQRSKTNPSRLSSTLHHRNTSDSTDGSNSWALPSSPIERASPGTSSSIESVDGPETTTGPWLPIYPPLLSDENMPRARITPASYPTIYSKIVVQSLSPNIPIPLTEMVQALVHGWKAEGNWPPQPAPVVAQDVKTGKSSSNFLRWRTEQEDGGHKGRVRRSLGAVKRVLGAPISLPTPPEPELGIEFREQDADEMESNVTLNKGLVEPKSQA